MDNTIMLTALILLLVGAVVGLLRLVVRTYEQDIEVLTVKLRMVEFRAQANLEYQWLQIEANDIQRYY